MTDRTRRSNRIPVSRSLGGLATAAAVLMALSACWAGGLPGDLTTRPTPGASETVASPGPVGLERYYEQRVTWTNCGIGLQCAEVIAPMNWAAPETGKDISLAMVRHPATGKTRLGSLFVNPGGPGGSGFDMVFDSVNYAVSEALMEQYDIVGWDPRGVGRSTPVSCFTDPKFMDDFLFGIPKANPKTDPKGWIAEVTASSVAFANGCNEHTGQVLQYVDTQSTVHDLDMLRALVGDPKLTYLGYSYGTEIGSYYADRFPQNVGRMVLDGATDPAISVFEVSLEQTRGFQRALENYLKACPDMFGKDCPFTGDLSVDLAKIRAVYDQADAHPVAAPDGRMMDAGVIDTALSAALYSQDSWQYLNWLFQDIAAGSTETAFLLADFYYGRNPDGTYANNMFEAFFAIYCVDYPVETDPKVLEEQDRLLQQAAPSTYRAFPPVGDTLCANWPYQYQGDGNRAVTATGAPPILIVATTGDPATPYEWGVRLSKAIKSAVLVTFNGEGHTAYNGPSACVNRTLDDYFLSGKVPAADPNCS